MAAEEQTTKCPQCGKAFSATVRICPDDGTVLEHDTQEAGQLGKVLDGKYRLDAFLSRGGMGAVYKATHVMLGKTVAVKLIKPELVTSPEVVRRFQREARAATALNHPNIVAVFDLGQTADGMLYIAMEFVDGPTLKSVIVDGPIAAARVVALMRQIVSALSVAHRNKIVHRDLKPQNIMLARGGDGHEIVKLVDFGIAKTFDDATQLTMDGDAIGTPHYMAPEQSAGKPVDGRSDLYSVGIILYEMLTGVVPFDDTSAPAILVKHLQEMPERPSLKNPSAAIPAGLEAIALKCLEKDPANRFQTADDLAVALDEAAAAIPGAPAAIAAIQMQQTMPMAAATTVTQAATAAAAVAAGPPAGSNAVAPTAASVRAGDTRPTAVPPERQGAIPGVTAPPKPASSSSSLVAIVVVLLIAAAGGIFYLKRGAQDPGSSTSPAPVASSTPAPPPTASPAMAAESTPAPSSSSSAEPVAAPPATGAASDPASVVGAGRSAANGGGSAAGGAATSDGKAAGVARSSVSSGGAPGGQSAASAATIVSGGARLPSSGAAPASRTAQANEPARQAPAAFPANPSVYFQCVGAQEICSPLRSAVDSALEKGGLPNVRNASRADVSVIATATVLQEQDSRQFGTTFTVRNYSIEVSGEAPRTSEAVPMPPATTLSFDQRFGSERATETSRLIASDLVDKVQAFAKKKQ